VRLHVEYAERGKEYGILFISSLFYEYIHLDYVRIHVIYRVIQAEYVLLILVIAPQDYVNINSTRRLVSLSVPSGDLVGGGSDGRGRGRVAGFKHHGKTQERAPMCCIGRNICTRLYNYKDSLGRPTPKAQSKLQARHRRRLRPKQGGR